MKKPKTPLDGVRDICLALPETTETLTWGQPHFRVRGKIFAGCGEEGGKASLGFKLERAHAEAILDDPRFRRAPYVGHAGWVTMDPGGVRDWDEVRELLHESYRLIAPKSCQAKMSENAVPVAKAKSAAKAKAPAKPRSAAKPKSTAKAKAAAKPKSAAKPKPPAKPKSAPRATTSARRRAT